MDKYVIIPWRNYQSEDIEAETPEEAMEHFATTMDLDMNQYFRAVKASELSEVLRNERKLICDTFNIDWMEDELIQRGVSENYSTAYAVVAHEYYRPKDHNLGMECIDQAHAEHMRNILDLWDEFGDIPMDPETETLDEAWRHFKPGTHREEVWKWFEDEFHIVVGELMNNRTVVFSSR